MNNSMTFEKVFNKTLEIQTKIETPLVALSIYVPGKIDLFWYDETKTDFYEKRRSSDYIFCPHSNQDRNILIYGIYDKHAQNDLSAILGICQTFGVCIILSLGAYLFTKITGDLIIDPIENMIERVKHITNDPLSAVHEEEERILIDHIRYMQKGNKKYDLGSEMDKEDEEDELFGEDGIGKDGIIAEKAGSNK